MYHLEVIKIQTSKPKAFCRIYEFDAKTIRQVISINVSKFTNNKSSLIESDCGHNLSLKDNLLTISDFGINGFQVEINSARTLVINITDEITQKSSSILSGEINEYFLGIINLENKKLRDKLNYS